MASGYNVLVLGHLRSQGYLGTGLNYGLVNMGDQSYLEFLYDFLEH